MSVEQAIQRLLEETQETENNTPITEEELKLLTPDELKGLVENFEQLDEVSRETLAKYVGSITDLSDTDNADEETRKAKGKVDQKDPNENENTSSNAKGPESKDYNIKKDVGFESGEQTEEIGESIDLGGLFEGQELSEEFKEKATTIFESAVAARVAQELEKRSKELAESLDTQFNELNEGLTDKVDGYLGYIAEQWLQKNELALGRGIKADLFESFVSGLKNLFEEHYVTVPEDELDVLEGLTEEMEQLKTALNEATEHNIELSSTLKDISRDMQIQEAAEGLSDVQAEKFYSLVENIAFEDEDSFGKKLDTIRENYFGRNTAVAHEETHAPRFMSDAPVESLTEETQVKPNIDPSVAMYAKHLPI